MKPSEKSWFDYQQSLLIFTPTAVNPTYTIQVEQGGKLLVG
jgi:hypothetical protein